MRKRFKKLMAFSLIIGLLGANPVYGAVVENTSMIDAQITDENVSDEAEYGLEVASTSASDFTYSVDGVKECVTITGYNGQQSEVIIPDSIEGYPVSNIKNIFTGNLTIMKVVIPNTVQTIQDEIFKGCTNLEEVILSNSLKRIPRSCFFECSSLSNIEIPSSVEYIDAWAFRDCYNLQNVNLPDGLKSIGESVFAGCDKITRITLPDSVNDLQNAAFARCNSLEYVKFPVGLEEMGNSLFWHCASLREIVWPKTLKTLPGNIFLESGLEEVVLPASLKEITGYAFNEAANLRKIIIPGTDTSIPGTMSSFIGCDKLKYIVFYGNGELGFGAFNHVPGDTKIYGTVNSHAYEQATERNLSFYKINAPTGFTLESAGDTAVKLTWDAVNHIDGYKVYRSTDPETGFTEIANVTENTYTDSNLNSGQDYYYKVCIYYNHGEIIEGICTDVLESGERQPDKQIGDMDFDYSATARYTGSEIRIPLTIKDGSAELQEDVDYTLTYSDNIDVGTASILVQGIGKYSGTYTIYFEIVSEEEGDSLAAPVILAVSRVGTNALEIEWEPVEEADGYIIYRSEDDASEFEEILDIDSSDISSYFDRELEGKKQYFYRIQAYKELEEGRLFSEYSEIDSGISKAGKIKLNKTKASITVGKTTKLKLSNAYGKIKWSSSKKSVAKVSSTGLVTAKKAGKATITAKYNGKKYKCVVTVNKKVITYKSLEGKAYTYKNSEFLYSIVINDGKINFALHRAKRPDLASLEDFAVKYKKGKYKYTATGWRSSYKYDITVTPGKSSMKLTLRCQNREYNYFDISNATLKYDSDLSSYF